MKTRLCGVWMSVLCCLSGGLVDVKATDFATLSVNVPGRWAPLAVGELLAETATGTGQNFFWLSLPDLLVEEDLEFYFLTEDPTKSTAEDYGRLDFEAVSDGAVWMLVTQRFEASGSPGAWNAEQVSREELENDGWHLLSSDIVVEVGNASAGQNTQEQPWFLFERQAVAGEMFGIRTEKHRSPIVVRLRESFPGGLPDQSHPKGSGPVRWEIADGGNGHFYEYVDVEQRWLEARTTAKGLAFGGYAGHLVNISTAGENQFVATVIPEDEHSVWLGGNDLDTEGEWVWGDGPEVGQPLAPYESWDVREPRSDEGNNRDAAIYLGPGSPGGPNSVGNWYAGDQGWHRPIVVEYSPNPAAEAEAPAGEPSEALAIVKQPEDLSISAGDSVRFEAAASGPLPLAYQWYFRGAPIPSAINRSVVFHDVPFEQSGEYWVEVRDALGNARLSERATLVVDDPLAEARSPLASLVSGRTIRGLSDSALRFLPPEGAGKNRRMGIVFQAGADWTSLGTSWTFDWLGNSSGVQLVHPVGPGLCLIAIHRDTIGISTPERWVEVGYGPGDDTSVTRTTAFDRYFPLTDGLSYKIETQATPGGDISVYINRQLVAQAQVLDASPIDFGVGPDEVFPHGGPEVGKAFSGDNFPMVWGKGVAGLVLEPVERELNELAAVSFSPAPEARPVIVSQPQDAELAEGQRASLVVEVESESPVRYQWYYQGEAIESATGSSLTIPSFGPDNEGDYHVVLSNSGINPTLSRTARLSLMPLEAPEFIIQPMDMVVPVGSSASLLAAAEGTPPLSFQWFFEGDPIDGANSPILNLNNLTLEDSGVYLLRVESGTDKFAVSDPARLQVVVIESPRITLEPENLEVSLGDTTELAVAAAGTPPLSFQWYFEGAAIAGANGATLGIKAESEDQAGAYWVTVSSPHGEVESRRVIVSVFNPFLPPVNDDFADRLIIEGTEVMASGDNTNATAETNEPRHGDFAGGHSVWWRWEATRDAQVTVATAGSEIDTILAVYEGERVDGLTLVAANDDAHPGETTSRLMFDAVAGTDYQIAVDGFGELSGAIALALNAIAVMPRLHASVSGQSLVLTWEPLGGDYQVEETKRVNGGEWTVVEIEPVALGNELIVKLPIVDGQQFFRLIEREQAGAQ